MKVPSIKLPDHDRTAAESRPGAATPSPPTPPASAPSRPARGPFGYFARLWRAEIALSRVFWRDMLVAGTLVNVAAMGLAFLAAALGATTATGIAIFMAPVPYNLLLVVSVWRRADIERVGWGWGARIGALLWLILAFVI